MDTAEATAATAATAAALTLDQRRALCAATVTLNGQPARITGARGTFAIVRDTATGLGAEWAWSTVARIVAAGGRFTS